MWGNRSTRESVEMDNNARPSPSFPLFQKSESDFLKAFYLQLFVLSEWVWNSKLIARHSALYHFETTRIGSLFQPGQFRDAWICFRTTLTLSQSLLAFSVEFKKIGPEKACFQQCWFKTRKIQEIWHYYWPFLPIGPHSPRYHAEDFPQSHRFHPWGISELH